MNISPVQKPGFIKSIALGMVGMLIGALIFLLGAAVGVLVTRQGGVLPFGSAPGMSASGERPSIAGQSEATIGTDTTAATATGRINQKLVDEVLRRLRNEWYGDMPSDETLTNGAIRGMVNALNDPFTQYVEPSLARIMEEDISGTFEGIGATLRTVTGGGIQIVKVFKNSPAEKAGVQANDIIEAVNGRPVTGLGTNEVAALVRGPKGTPVTLKLRRGDQPRTFDLEIVRGQIVIPLVTSKMIGTNSDIAYISLFDFSAQANKQLTHDLEALLNKKPRALILDLRDNPGGLLSQSVEIGDLFLKKGPFVVQRDYKGNRKQTDVTDRGMAQEIPLAVLVNGGSASAAEIVAGAIQDVGRAKLFGENTYGKGSVQSPQRLPNGGQLRITIERWYTPKDRAINGVGIKPDFLVINTPEDGKAGIDRQLDAAVKYLETGATP